MGTVWLLLENHGKTMENHAGKPVCVHGVGFGIEGTRENRGESRDVEGGMGVVLRGCGHSTMESLKNDWKTVGKDPKVQPLSKYQQPTEQRVTLQCPHPSWEWGTSSQCVLGWQRSHPCVSQAPTTRHPLSQGSLSPNWGTQHSPTGDAAAPEGGRSHRGDTCRAGPAPTCSSPGRVTVGSRE